MKIIAGKFKNRVIPTLKNSDYRPSTAKFREALFSILSSGQFQDDQLIENSKVLDLFAGTGSLSLEALSRGSQNITLIDNNKEALDLVNQFVQKINCQDNVKTIVVDATNLPRTSQKYSLVFMDPPYHKDYVAKTLASLDKNEWLEVGAVIAIEMSKYDKINFTDKFELLKEKLYGNNRLLILKYE
ncbi:MAG: 16S rRNA (guanine(966)-N(2))-methyltransferase RsmD [Rickettsiales bacterium]|nr:MAG: 16S rRNA (guanine(966)-N(2))-methyltransferase RsmD [Rickettsiales bacterium]